MQKIHLHKKKLQIHNNTNPTGEGGLVDQASLKRLITKILYDKKHFKYSIQICAQEKNQVKKMQYNLYLHNHNRHPF